jgi:putative transposase
LFGAAERAPPFFRRMTNISLVRGMRSLQKFASVEASIYNLFHSERSLQSRSNFKLNRAAAVAGWRDLCSA